MKVSVMLPDGTRHAADLPHPGADHVTVDAACPHGCQRAAGARLAVRGTGISGRSHDTYSAAALTLCCGLDAGIIEARMSTIFGLEEDERVLSGRCRVY